MSFLIILAILTGLVGFGLKEWFQYKLGCAPRGITPELRQNLVRICSHFGKQGNFLDIGSAWGSTIFNMAKALPEWQFDGIEKSPTPWIVSQLRSALFRFKNYRLFLADATRWPLAGYDIVFVNVGNSQLRLLHSRLKNYADAGTIVILLNKQFKDFPNHQEMVIDDKHKLHMYLLLPEVAQTDIKAPEILPEALNETLTTEPTLEKTSEPELELAFVDPSPAETTAPVPPSNLTLADMAAHIKAEK